MSLVLGLHCDGSDASTTFTDSSPNSFAVTALGNAQIDTAQSKFGGASGLFDGTGAGLFLDDASPLHLGSGDWTVQFWIRWNSLTGTQTIASKGYSVAGGWVLQTDSGNGRLIFYSGSPATAVATESSGTINANQWYHIAVVRSSGTITIYRDGTSVASGSDSTDYNATTTMYWAGGSSTGFNNFYFNGWLDDISIDSSALYTSGFTPPSSPFQDPVRLTGIASGEAFGSHTVSFRASIAVTGIASGEAFGSPSLRKHPDTISLTGIASAGAVGTPTVSNRIVENLTESADATDPSTVTAGLYEAIRETLLCAADCDESALYNLSMSEAQAAIDSLIGGKLFQDAVSEVANGDVSTVVEIALRMVEQVAASDAVLTSWQTAMTVAEVATALDLVAAGWYLSMVETAEANDTITPFVAMLATLLEEAVATDTVANTMTVTVVSTETAAGADTVTTLAEFFETMDESAVATVTIRLGDDVYTGWVLNTEENAVSEFQRYEFNSFCQLQGEYYAAGTDGIYRIGGSSDAGEAIVGYLKTGLLDFGSSMQKRMDSAWLAIATDGTVRMKVVTTDHGEAEETWYQVTSRDEGAVAENMRLKIGKGLKSRHWQFELVVEDASEFELEELQFIPMILTRRT